MLEPDEISGGGGGGGGSSGSQQDFTQTPDNLRSEDLFEGLLGLGHGAWKGPVNGMKSVRVFDTPFEDSTGKSNFPSWVAQFANGDPLMFPQKPELVLGTGAAPININVQLANPSGTGTAVVRTVTNDNADFIDLRFIVSELFRQDKNGVFENTMHIRIRMKPSGHSTWIDVLVDTTSTEPAYAPYGLNLGAGVYRYYSENYYSDTGGNSRISTGIVSGQLTITGKTTSPYVKEVRIAVPNTGAYVNTGWDIECTLMDVDHVDADPNFEKRTVTWESASAVYKDDTLGTSEAWRGLAWLSLYGTASDRVSSRPEIWGEYETKIVSVPPTSVYNSTTRQYTGTVWDGSYIKAYTNDVAWCINDILQDTIAGVSAIAPGSYLNKWDALELSKYCSALVPDGDGGTHCRFSMNGVFNNPVKADEFVRMMAGSVGALAWDNGGGEWRCKIDKIENPVALFTEENIEGEFIYSHTDVDTRFNDITVKFLNAEFDYREDRVRLFDQADIDANGRKVTTIEAIGCTNRQEARRRGMLRLRTSINEFRMVSFTTNRQGRFFEPLTTILVADKSLGYEAPSGSTGSANTDARDHTTGRILSLNGARTQITLRDPMRLEPGASYTVKVTTPNSAYNPDATSQPPVDYDKPTLVGTYTVATGSPRGDVTTITLTSALPANTPPNAVIALSATGLPALPKTYRIVGLEESEDHERVSITAVEVDTGKYAAADAVPSDTPTVGLPPSTCPPPTAPSGGMLTIDTFASNYSFQRVLEIQWVKPDSQYIAGYLVTYRLNNGPEVKFPQTTELRVEIPNPQFGEYDVQVRAVDTRGGYSQPLEGAIVVNEQALIGAIGYLTNETVTLPSNTAGAILDYTGASGEFKVLIGTVDVTLGCTFAISSNPQALTGPYTAGSPLNTATGQYSVTGGYDAAEANGYLTMVATHTASGLTVTKTFSLSKNPNAKIMTLTTSSFTFVYADGAAVPNAQTTTITATRRNPGSATTVWSVLKPDGTALISNVSATSLQTAGYATRVTDDQITISHTQFDTKCDANSVTALIIRAAFSDLTTDYDQISLVKVADGSSALSAYLTNAAVTIATNPDGTGGDYSNAGGQVKVFWGGVDVTNTATYAITGTTGGLDAVAPGVNISIDSLGFYTVTGLNYDNGTADLRATYNGISLDMIYSIAKAYAGQPGSGGNGISLVAEPDAFTFSEDSPNPTNQTITITATLSGPAETLTWLATPTVTLGAPSGLQRTLTVNDFGINDSVTIKATGNTSGLSASVTIWRDEVGKPLLYGNLLKDPGYYWGLINYE